MQEIIFTLIVFFILFKVFRPRVNVYYYNSNKHNHYHEQKQPEGKVTITQSADKKPAKKGDNDGDFVEYEEVK